MIKKLIGKLRFRMRHLKFKVMAFEDNRRRAIWRHEQAKKYAVSHNLQPLINRLTNWQRSQWARAGYPRKVPEDIEPFTQMQKQKRRKHDPS